MNDWSNMWVAIILTLAFTVAYVCGFGVGVAQSRDSFKTGKCFLLGSEVYCK